MTEALHHPPSTNASARSRARRRGLRRPAPRPSAGRAGWLRLLAGLLAAACTSAPRLLVYAHARAGRALARAGGWAALAGLLAAAPAAAGPVAGTPIPNTAQGACTDVTGTLVMRPLSNTVQAVVQPLEGLRLTPGPARTARPGEGVVFAHVLRNAGNAAADFRLELANLGGDDFDLDAPGLVLDRDRDGAVGGADAPLANGGLLTLAAGDSAALLVTGTVAPTAPGLSRALLTLTATSLAQGATAAVTDTVLTPPLGPPPTIAFFAAADFAQVTRRSRPDAPLYVQVVAPQADARPATVDTLAIRLETRLSGDREDFQATETGPNTGTFRIVPALTTLSLPEGNAAVAGDGTVTERRGGEVTATVFGYGATRTDSHLWVDPAGLVFDAGTGGAVGGARVRLVDMTGAGNGGRPGDLARVRTADGAAPAPADVLSDAQGRYEFPWVAPSLYRLLVSPPEPYRFPSAVPPVALDPAYVIDVGGSYGQSFPVAEDGAPVVMDLPLDADRPVVLFAEKAASRPEAELGDDVGYQVRVANRSDSTVAALLVRDAPPAGFAYVGGSARLDGVPLADPARGAGALAFALGPLAPRTSVTLSYRLRVGPGASLGDALNRAVAEGGEARSNEAVARVTVRGGVFADEGVILGTVGLDADGDGRLSAGDPGLAGVRLVLDDGTWAVTDGRGRFSFTGVPPRTHALKLDPATLPLAATLVALDHRAGDQPGLRFVDLTRGELVRADFAVRADSALLRETLGRGPAGRAETERLLSRGGDPLVPPQPVVDPRTLPASRVLTGESGLPLARREGPASDPLPVPAAPAGAGVGLSAAAAADPAGAALEQLVPELNAELGFVGLVDLDTVAANQIAVRVKGAAGTGFELFVNGDLQSATRVARRVVAPASGVEAWEYLGVELQPGLNLLEVSPPGSPGRIAVRVIAPGPLAALALAPPAGAPADGVTAARVTLSLLDASGLPVGARTLVTLESTLGRVRLADLDPAAAGVQIAVEGGRAVVPLEAPTEPGLARLTAVTGTLRAVALVPFTAEARRPLAVGTLEGTLGWNGFSRRGAAADPREARFEAPVTQFAAASRDGRATAAARGALYLKGRVTGPWSLTLGYDSDRERDARRFRDLQPDAGYAVLGDASVRGYDAQSTGRLYTRVERPGAWLLYGDYVTNGIGAPPEGGSRSLAAYSRSLSGAQSHWESGPLRVDAFTSRDRTRSRTEELPGLGISGPYQLGTFPFAENTERVEIVVRDRDHPSVVLSTTPRERFTDYEAEPFTGRVLFRTPVPSHDEAMNPVFVRVTYEVRGLDGGPAGLPFWVHGATARWKALPRLELSGTTVDDHDPTAERALRGAAFRAELAPRTTLEGEWALAHRLGESGGHGGRVELRHAARGLDARLWGVSTGARFDNPTAGFAGGRNEAGAKLSTRLAERTRLDAEASYSGDDAGLDRRGGGLLALDRTLSNALHGQLGLRVSDGTRHPGGGDPRVAALRTRFAWQPPSRPQWTGYAEAEQDVRAGARRMAAVGGEYRVAQRGRVYARHELISSLGSTWDLNGAQQRLATVVGVDADVRRDQHLFGEYRLADAMAGREAQAAVGLRNGWQLSPGVRLGTSFERVSPFGEGRASAGATTAGAVAVDLTGKAAWKGSSRVELRANRSGTQFLQTVAAAVQLDSAWTGLFRHALSVNDAHGAAGGDEARELVQLGLAWRPGGDWEGLARTELRCERGASALSPTALDAAGVDPRGRRTAGILSLSADGRVTDRDVASLAWAGKVARERSRLGSSSGGGQWLRARTTRDLPHGWDVGWTASVLTGGAWSQRRWGLGAELGRQLPLGTWLSLGFNRFGYQDDELAGEEWTREGVYLRLRMKVDETALSRLGAGR